MAPDETELDEAKDSGQPALVAYLCHFRPEPRRVHGQLSQAASVVTYGKTLEEAQANAREAIELCLEVMREDGQPFRRLTGISPHRSTSWCLSPPPTHEGVAGAAGAQSSRPLERAASSDPNRGPFP